MFMSVANHYAFLRLRVQLSPLIIGYVHICNSPEYPPGASVQLPFEIQIMCRHCFYDPILDVDRGSNNFGPVELGDDLFPPTLPMALLQPTNYSFRPCRFSPACLCNWICAEFPFVADNSWIGQKSTLFRHLTACTWSPYLYPIGEDFSVPETVKESTLLFDQVDPRLPAVVVDEGD